jgi:hypothetical protein
MPLTNAEKQKAHRRRVAEKMARLVSALEAIADLPTRDVHDGYDDNGNYIWVDYISAVEVRRIASAVLNPTIHTADAD